MKDKVFIRILSPITVAVVLLIDIFAIGYGVYSVIKIMENPSAITICFAIMMAIVIVISGFVTKEVFSNGVLFRDDNIEFIGLDNDNLFEYKDIEKLEFHRDDKVSFKKNFNDRHSILILHLKDERVATIDIGLTTKKVLLKIVDQINNRIK